MTLPTYPKMTAQPIQLTAQQFNDLLGRLSVGTNNEGGATASSKNIKPVRPTVDIDTSEGEWALFEDEWARFKRMAKLTAADEIRDNLRQCCAAQLNKRLFDTKGSAMLNAASETQLCTWIKEIAVKGLHKEVHRTQFVRCRQKQGECLNAYHGRLKAASSLCDFRVPAPSACADTDCTCAHHGMQISYQDDMVATQLIAGLYNSDHQAKVLSESATLVTLDAKLERLLTLEKSDTSLSSLSNNEAFSNVVRAESDDGRIANNGRRRRRGNSQRQQPKRPQQVKDNPLPVTNLVVASAAGLTPNVNRARAITNVPPNATSAKSLATSGTAATRCSSRQQSPTS